jgi:hypothetical protein
LAGFTSSASEGSASLSLCRVVSPEEFGARVRPLAAKCSEPALRRWLVLLLEDMLRGTPPLPDDVAKAVGGVIALLPNAPADQLRAAAADAADAAAAAGAAAYAAGASGLNTELLLTQLMLLA